MALHFDNATGSGCYATASISLPITVAGWVNRDDTTGIHVIAGLSSSTSASRYHLLFFLDNNSALRAYSKNGGGSAGSAGPDITTGSWFHAAGVFASATSRKAYVNGTAGSSSTTNLDPSTDRICIGCYFNGSTTPVSVMDGKVSWVAIWNAALSTEEITELYGGGIGADPLSVRPESLICRYPLFSSSPRIDWFGAYDLSDAGTSPSVITDDPPVQMSSGLWVPWQVAVPAGGGGASATVAQTLPRLTQAVTTDVAVAGTVAQTLPRLSQSATAAVAVSGSIAQTLPRISQAATAAVAVSATAAQTLPRVTQSATASVGDNRTATVAQTLPRVTQAATTEVAVAGTIAQTLPRITQAATAAVAVTATAAQTLPRVTQAATATGSENRTANVAQTLPRLSQAITAAVQVAGEINQTLPRLSQAATTAVAVTATVSQTLPRVTQSATASDTTPRTATVAQTLPRVTQVITAAAAAWQPDSARLHRVPYETRIHRVEAETRIHRVPSQTRIFVLTTDDVD